MIETKNRNRPPRLAWLSGFLPASRCGQEAGAAHVTIVFEN